MEDFPNKSLDEFLILSTKHIKHFWRVLFLVCVNNTRTDSWRIFLRIFKETFENFSEEYSEKFQEDSLIKISKEIKVEILKQSVKDVL